MTDAQKKFWKTFMINGIVIFTGVTIILAGADYVAIKKAQQKTPAKTPA